MARKRLIPVKVTAAITTTVIGLIFLVYGLPDSNSILQYLIDQLYTVSRPLLTGAAAEHADQLYNVITLIFTITMILGLISLAVAIFVVASWMIKTVKKVMWRRNL